MSVPLSCPSATATIIGTDSLSPTVLCGLLNQLGLGHVITLDSWDPLRTETQMEHTTLYFVGWEQWGPETLQWITKLKTVDKKAGPAKFFLIIPNDYSLNRVAAIQGGVDGFISYPYSLSNLRQKIQAILPTMAVKAPVSQKLHKQKKPPARKAWPGAASTFNQQTTAPDSPVRQEANWWS